MPASRRDLVGVDVFLAWSPPDRDPDVLGRALVQLAGDDLELRVVTNRGVRVFPDGLPETLLSDHWRCRFAKRRPLAVRQVIDLLARIDAAGFEVIKTEHLYEHADGLPGYSLAQGE